MKRKILTIMMAAPFLVMPIMAHAQSIGSTNVVPSDLKGHHSSSNYSDYSGHYAYGRGDIYYNSLDYSDLNFNQTGQSIDYDRFLPKKNRRHQNLSNY